METKASAFSAAITPVPQLQLHHTTTSTMFLRANSQLRWFNSLFTPIINIPPEFHLIFNYQLLITAGTLIWPIIDTKQPIQYSLIN